jgi:hypothetical protein
VLDLEITAERGEEAAKSITGSSQRFNDSHDYGLCECCVVASETHSFIVGLEHCQIIRPFDQSPAEAFRRRVDGGLHIALSRFAVFFSGMRAGVGQIRMIFRR